ncbi:MAG: TonB-dependent receptor, partial [Ignavibacteria bacterium]|nr:TonB-dependent receptor [Ignavibacteria bacterium]
RIENSNGSQLSDVLHTANSVYIKSYGGNSSLKTISINGLSAENTLILVNGAKLNSSQNAQFDLSLFSRDVIENIEILPSNSSSTYGPDAISGIINISTFRKPGEYGKFNALLSSEVGSYNFRKINAGISNKISGNLLTLDYSHVKSDDDFSYYFNDGYGESEKNRMNNSFETNSFSVRNTLEAGKTKVNFISLYNSASRKIPGIETGSAPSFALQNDKNWLNTLTFDNQINAGSQIRANFNFQNNLSNFDYPGIENSFYKNISTAFDFNYIHTNNNIRVFTGGSYSYATIYSNQISGEPVRNNAALYAASEFNLDKVIFYPSARYDFISDIDKSVFTGKLGFNYKPLKSFIIRGNAGNAFRAPTFNELYWKTGGNQNLVPEKSVNLEAGLAYSTDIIFRSTAELNYYYIASTDKILWVPGNSFYWTPENISKSVSSVINMNLKTRILETDGAAVTLNAGYSYNNTFKNSEDFLGDPSYGKQLIYIPFHDFKFGAESAYKNAGINLFGYYTAKRYSDSENKNMMENIFTLDGNIFYKLNLFRISAVLRMEVNNITNSGYQVIAGYPMPLRNYKFSITFKY